MSLNLNTATASPTPNLESLVFSSAVVNESIPHVSSATYDENEWQKHLSDNKVIPYLDSEQVTYEQFFGNFLGKNIPCMFSPGLTAAWLSRQMWTNGEQQNEINFGHLLDVYGDAQVCAVNCDDPEYREGYGTRDCRDMSFKAYIDYLKNGIGSNSDIDKPCLYLKDWHIVRFHRSANDTKLPYECPVYFQSDWLNEFSEDKDMDDYKFCYIGPNGSFTSFHADVYGSYSWSANVIGVKKWFLYPPGKEIRFYDTRLKKLNFNWGDAGVQGEDYFEVIQNSGECLFVPSGWHHVVWNLTDAISINHNWFNGANLCYIWSMLQSALKEVEKELEDLRHIQDFHEQCQLVLKANHGMNYEGFFTILEHIMGKRSNTAVPTSQTRFDIKAILHVLENHCAQDSIVQKHFPERVVAFMEPFDKHENS